jgi:GDSL-like Lipase/Acylhydrolase family
MTSFQSFLRSILFVSMITAAAMGSAQNRPRSNPALAPIEADPALPDVLLIGDSISIGYTLPVRELLAGEANVHRIPENGGPTTRGLAQIDKWLGDRKWDVIHFNWGLHDLKYVDDKAQLASPDTGHQQVPLEEYEANLTRLIERLQQTGAKLIWCSTTPVPEGAAGRVPGDEVKYNEAAARVMDKHGIPTDDLNSFASDRVEKIQRPANVHFTPEGSRTLAEEVVRHIRKALADDSPQVSLLIDPLTDSPSQRELDEIIMHHRVNEIYRRNLLDQMYRCFPGEGLDRLNTFPAAPGQDWRKLLPGSL